MDEVEVRVLAKTCEIVTDIDSVLDVRQMIGNLKEDLYRRRHELGGEFGWLWDCCNQMLARQERPFRFLATGANNEKTPE